MEKGDIQKPGKPGRKRLFGDGQRVKAMILPVDLLNAIETFRARQKLTDYADAARELIRFACESKGLVEMRK